MFCNWKKLVHKKPECSYKNIFNQMYVLPPCLLIDDKKWALLISINHTNFFKELWLKNIRVPAVFCSSFFFSQKLIYQNCEDQSTRPITLRRLCICIYQISWRFWEVGSHTYVLVSWCEKWAPSWPCTVNKYKEIIGIL